MVNGCIEAALRTVYAFRERSFYSPTREERGER
jgi:hypothetical protein